ncbi:hypothetical protein F4777DRAFT_316182 [Nemania sp. FL0916]|nr:hypothetical protein F4777DRAFT_316182 [Nemania sp. FL0916]
MSNLSSYEAAKAHRINGKSKLWVSKTGYNLSSLSIVLLSLRPITLSNMSFALCRHMPKTPKTFGHFVLTFLLIGMTKFGYTSIALEARATAFITYDYWISSSFWLGALSHR